MQETLQEKIERITRETSDFKFKNEKKMKTSKAGRISSDVGKFQTFFAQLLSAFVWVFDKLVRPLFFWLRKPLKLVLNFYIKIWNKVVYKHDEYYIPIFSQIRAGLMVIATCVFLLVCPFLIQAVFDTGVYALTSKTNEHLILFGSQEVNAITGEHNVEGCIDTQDYEQRGCPDTETVYFRTKLSIFNEVWSLLFKHELYWPEYVAAAVPYTTSKCIADSYGVRIKFIMKDIEIYPNLLAVTCRPLSSGGAKEK